MKNATIVYKVLVPLTFINGLALGYFSIQTSISKDWLPFVFLVITNILPLWAFISKHSKDLIFDELLYNITVIISELIAILILGSGNAFSWLNWLGLLLAFIGFVLLKIGTAEKPETQLAQK